jgi:hypothetical protein
MSHEGRKIHITWYVLSDFTSAVLSWMILYFTRRDLLAEPIFIDGDLFLNNRFWLGLLLIPAGWIVFYALTGTYHSLYKKSRLSEFSSTAVYFPFHAFHYYLDRQMDPAFLNQNADP